MAVPGRQFRMQPLHNIIRVYYRSTTSLPGEGYQWRRKLHASSTATVYINLLLSPAALLHLLVIIVNGNTSPGMLTAGRPSGGNGTLLLSVADQVPTVRPFLNILNANESIFIGRET